MILHINKYGLNMGQDFEFVSNFIKGKSTKKLDLLKLRPIFKGVVDQKLYIWMMENHPVNGYSIQYIDEFKILTPIHYKNRYYNYYYLDGDANKMHEFLEKWRNSDPLVHVGNCLHQQISRINNYTWTYEFDNVKY